MEAGLYIVGTPIGNLKDITLRALEVLKEAHLIVAEDTRRTRQLLSHYNIHTPLLSGHRFNEMARAAQVVERIRGGQAVALVTDSGMPGVSDPGARLVRACYEAGLPVRCVPGPSAVTAALALSGWGGGSFTFAGFLPRKPGACERRLKELSERQEPLVIFESPHRLLATLERIEQVLPDRMIYVGRELTKHFEENLWGRAAELRDHFSRHPPRGEFVLVIGPPAA